MIKRKVPKALAEVWAWKEACYREVEHLPIREAVMKRLADCARAPARSGPALHATGAHAARSSRVAEGKSHYQPKKPRKT